MLPITWHSKQIQIWTKNPCKYAGKKITLLEKGQDISSKNRQELQTPSMIIKPFKKNIIRRLKSLSQVFLNPIESRKQHIPSSTLLASLPENQNINTPQSQKSIQTNLNTNTPILTYPAKASPLWSSSPRYCFNNSRTWFLLRSYSFASTSNNFFRFSFERLK